MTQPSTIYRVHARMIPNPFEYGRLKFNPENTPHSGYLLKKDGGLVRFDAAEDPQLRYKTEVSELAAIVVYLPKYKVYVGQWQTIEGWARRTEESSSYQAVIAAVKAAQEAEDSYHSKVASDPVFALEEALKRHDWTSHFADDFRYWAAGEKSWKWIQELAEIVGPDIADPLINKYAPKETDDEIA